MNNTPRIISMRGLWAAAFFTLAVSASGQDSPMSAREIYYGKARAHLKAASPSPRRNPPDRPAAPNSPPRPAEEERASKPQPNDATQFQDAGLKSLGLRYTILKRQGAGEYFEVDRDSDFSEGDQLRLELEPNDNGFLYVVNQGSSQRWSVLYPRGAEQGSNRVEAGRKYSIPAKGASRAITITSPSGVEKLFVVLSRNPEPDIENLIYRLGEKKPGSAEPPRTMLAQNSGPIQDDVVQRLRTTYSRDLIIEKVDDSKAPPDVSSNDGPKRPARTAEKAVYVVSPDPGEATVVADIELRHR
jgi:hypothetical protein